jgi:large subunit ribosomal protein L35
MPKLKSNKGALKRFKRTGGGRLLRNKAYGSHLMGKKSSKRKRNLRKPTLLDTTNRVQIARLIPYKGSA